MQGFNDYQVRVREQRIGSDSGTLLRSVLSLIGACAEFSAFLVPALESEITSHPMTQLLARVGDILQHSAEICTAADINMSEIVIANLAHIKKLKRDHDDSLVDGDSGGRSQEAGAVGDDRTTKGGSSRDS